MTLAQAAAAVGVSTSTLRRWVELGLIPAIDGEPFRGEWNAVALGAARLIKRLRDRGYSINEIQAATADGRLAFGPVAALFGDRRAQQVFTVRQAARRTGLSAGLIRQLVASLRGREVAEITGDEMELLDSVVEMLENGLPLDAMLQIARVYAQAIAQIADAEVRVHLYVHEPMLRARASPDEMARELTSLTSSLLPRTPQVLDNLHRRLLRTFIEQDVVGHMDPNPEGEGCDAGRMRVAIAFADLAGYTQLTEEAGELAALEVVERFTQAVVATLPDEARILKTLGDEVMVISPAPVALTEWAVGFQELAGADPLPRIGVHYGNALYRDGDYYGREVNLASRVAAESRAGQVLVTRPIVELVGDELEFEPIEPVALKGFSGATEIFLARPRGGWNRG